MLLVLLFVNRPSLDAQQLTVDYGQDEEQSDKGNNSAKGDHRQRVRPVTVQGFAQHPHQGPQHSGTNRQQIAQQVVSSTSNLSKYSTWRHVCQLTEP